MTHPAATRQEALARVAAGESARSIGQALGIADKTVLRWAEQVPEAMSRIVAPIKEKIADDATIAMVRAVTKLDQLVAEAEPFQLRDVAYSAKALSDIALDWRDGRKGGVVLNDNRDQRTNTLNVFAEMSLDQKRAALARLVGGGE